MSVLFISLLPPIGRFDGILLHAFPLFQGTGIILHALFIARRSRLGEPIDGLVQVLADAVAVAIEDAQIVLGRSVTGHGSFVIPVCRQFPVLRDAAPCLIEVS